MNQKTVVHIGVQRTGTTLLQRNVFPYMEGWIFLNDKSLWGWANQVIFQEESIFDAQRSMEAVELDEKKPAMLSFEHLAGVPILYQTNQRRTAERLAKVLPRANILITIRRQDELIASLYSLYVKNGGTLPFKKFICFNGSNCGYWPRLMGNHLHVHALDYSVLAGIYEENFPGRVKIIPFEIIRKGGHEFAESVCEAVGAKWDRNVELRKENSGFSKFELQIMRMSNPLFRTARNPNGILPTKLPLVGEIKPVRLIRRHPFHSSCSSGSILPSETRKLILRELGASNKKLSEKYSLDLDGMGYF